jgi:outer membrane receptor protein involved in Fe transport
MVSAAREDGRYRVGKIAYNYAVEPSQTVFPEVLGVEVGGYDLSTTTTDPTQVVVGPIQATKRQVDAITTAGYAQWLASNHHGTSSLLIRTEIADSRIRSKTSAISDLSVQRQQGALYSGLDLALPLDLHLEGKALVTKLRDLTVGPQSHETRSLAPSGVDMVLPGSSVGLAWQPHNFTIYAQAANLKRPPTLLEKYGDGGIIRDNPGLSPEKTLHREVGLHWRNGAPLAIASPLKRYQLRGALFRDDTRDRIVLLPSIAQTLRAQNALKTDVTGAEMAVDLTIWQTTLTGGYARLWPWDKSYKSRSRLIPGVAEHVATASLSQVTPWATIRLGSRYQSQVWRDSENSIAIPGYLIHDVTIDTTWQSLAWGLAVYNVTDRKRLPIYAAGTEASRGDTSYSDFAGMPLPGRNWRLSVSATF